MRRVLSALLLGVNILIHGGCTSNPSPFADDLVLHKFDAEVKVGTDALSKVQGASLDASLKSESQSIASAYSDHAKTLRDQLSYLFNVSRQDDKQAKTEQERISLKAKRDRLVELANEQVARAQAISLLAKAFESNPTDASFKELRDAIVELMQQQPSADRWQLREEYDAHMRTGILFAGRQDRLMTEMYHYGKSMLEGIGAEPLVMPGPLLSDQVQQVAEELHTLTHEDIMKWAQLRTGIESRIEQRFGSSVAALARTPPTAIDDDPFFAFTRILASLTPEVLSGDHAERGAWAASAVEALEQAHQAYGSGIEGNLAIWRDSVLRAMDEVMTKETRSLSKM